MITTTSITEKLALLNSSRFMSFWKKGGEAYEKVLREWLDSLDVRSFKRYIKKNYDFNDYDFETIRVDAEHLSRGETLTNERKMGEKPTKKQSPEEPFKVPEVTKEQQEEVDKEFKNYQPKKPEEPEEPLYETKQISVKRLSVGDVIPFEDLLWCVTKQLNKNFIIIQELYSGRTKRFDLRNKGSIDVLTDDQVYKIVEEFKQDKSFNNLPKILQDAYQI